MLSFLLSFLISLNTLNLGDDQMDPCKVYGKIYFTSSPNRAHFSVYVEDSESFADVIVFKEQNSLYADRSGHWRIVESRDNARILLYLEKNRNLADFSIYYTDYESYAGCN